MKRDEVLDIVGKHPEYLPDILSMLGTMLEEYREQCEVRNNTLLREAIGDAVHLLSMDRKPNNMGQYCQRIKDAIYPKGLTDFHHSGEVRFYNRYLREE